MFEVGKRYEIRMLANGREILMFATVEKYEHPLVKLNDVMGGDQGIPGCPSSGNLRQLAA